MVQKESDYFNGVQWMSNEHQTDSSESSSEEVLPGTYWLRLLSHSCAVKIAMK